MMQRTYDYRWRFTSGSLEERRTRRANGGVQRRPLPWPSYWSVLLLNDIVQDFSDPRFSPGPLVGGFITDSKGWRWLYGIQLIRAGFVYVLMAVTVPETYAPTILLKRARHLRKSATTRSACRSLLLQRQRGVS